MDFENTWTLLHLLWIAPMFGILVFFASVKRKKVLARIFGENAMDPQYSTLSRGRRYLRTWLLFGAILLLVVAVARPRWGWRILPFSGRGRDLMIVLDVSKSMNSEDVKPSRLKHAKLFLRDLIKACPGDRFGLVAFAGSAFLDCPLTVDKTSLFQTLDETNTDSIPIGGTNIENALKTAITAFQAAEGGYRAIVLVTDGDELVGDSSQAIAELKAFKIQLFVIGIGDPTGDGLIKLTDSDGKTVLMRDDKGDLIKSRLNEIQLKKLAQNTNGIYVRSTETNPEMNPILKRIKALVPKEYEKGNNKRPIERFHFPLFAAVILLLIRLGIGERRRTNGNGNSAALAIIALGCLLGATPVQAQQAPPVPDRTSLSLGDEIPVDNDKKNIQKNQRTAIDLYNSGLKLQQEKNTEEALKRYQQAINLSGSSPEVRGKSFQNLGVISHNEGRAAMAQDPDKALKIFDKTEEMYREAMRSDTHLKKVILNQQKLIDDRILAKQIKKQKEELKKKQQEAQKKTKEALKQQQQENKQQQDKKEQKKDKQDQKQQQKEQQQQQKQDQQQQQQQKQQQQQQQDQQKQDQEQKQDQNKQPQQDQQSQQQKQDQKQQKDQQDKQSPQQQNQQQQETEKKISEAQKAIEELKKEAQKRKNSDIRDSADQAQQELKKAQQEHRKGKGKESEEHIKKALEKLAMSNPDSKEDNKGNQDKTGKDQQKDAEKKEQDKDKEQNKEDEKNRKLQKHKPAEQEKSEQQEKEKKEKEIDPRQAAALLEMMANDEKNLRDALKEEQKNNSRIRKVLKDW